MESYSDFITGTKKIDQYLRSNEPHEKLWKKTKSPIVGFLLWPFQQSMDFLAFGDAEGYSHVGKINNRIRNNIPLIQTEIIKSGKGNQEVFNLNNELDVMASTFQDDFYQSMNEDDKRIGYVEEVRNTIAELQGWVQGNSIPINLEAFQVLPEIELKTQKEQIRMLYDLGVIEYLIDKYPKSLKDNNNQVSQLLSKVLKEQQSSLQPTVNALLMNNAGNKNYPKETSRTKALIDHLNSNEVK